MKTGLFNFCVLCVVLVVSNITLCAQTPDPYLSQPLTFVANEDRTEVRLCKTSYQPYVNPMTNLYLQYSTDGGDTWTNIVNKAESGTPVTYSLATLAEGDSLIIRRDPNQGVNKYGLGDAKLDNEYYYFSSTGDFSLKGNIMSLLDGTNFATKTEIPSADVYCFINLFKDNTALTDISDLCLPATTLKTRCYHGMFSGCTGLTSLVDFQLPATTLAAYCYSNMFDGCTGLTTIWDEIEVGAIGEGSMKQMFNACTSLTKSPKITATSIGNASTAAAAKGGCYQMFAGSGLQEVQDITVTSAISGWGCQEMFVNCTSLATVGDLSVTGQIGQNGCLEMFKGCTTAFTMTKLTAGSVYGPTSTSSGNNVKGGCYHMFYESGITSLGAMEIGTIGIIGSTTGYYGCRLMFEGCTQLTTSPTITVTDKVGYCGCHSMFLNCTNLTTAGDIEVTNSIGQYAFVDMFKGTALTNIPNISLGTVEGAESPKGGCYHMFNALSSTIEGANVGDIHIGTINAFGCQEMFINCTGLSEAPQIIVMNGVGESGFNSAFKGCNDIIKAGDISITGNVGKNGFANMYSGCSSLKNMGKVTVSGDLGTTACSNMFLNDVALETVDDFMIGGQIGQNACSTMFSGCTTAFTMTKLTAGSVYGSTSTGSNYNYYGGCYRMFFNSGIKSLDAIEIGTIKNNYGCRLMFEGCTQLTTSPTITVTDKVGYCGCHSMFLNCTNLTTAGDIEVTNSIGQYAFVDMFKGTALTNIPNISLGTVEGAESPKGGCYHMFNGLSSIISAGDITIGTINAYGCQQMFNGCSGLESAGDITIGTINAYGCQQMFNGCSGLESVGDITIGTINAYGCQQMFLGCSDLKTIQDVFEVDTIGNYGCHQMFRNCTSLEAAPAITVHTGVGTGACNAMFSACGASLKSVGDISIANSVGTYAFANIYSGASALTTTPKFSANYLVAGKDTTGGCYHMYYNLTGLTRAQDITIGTICANGCRRMFEGCSSLATIQDVLQIDSIGATGCYQMFYKCTQLNKACGIQARGIGASGCKEMFYTCYDATGSTGITAAGDITVTGSAGTTAFTNMYSGDLALTQTPKVSVGVVSGTGEKTGACYMMFNGLTSLTSADSITFGTINAYGCQQMYNGCSNLETIQSVLHADTIGDAGCYQMYINCKKLNRACGIQTQGIGTSGCKEMFKTCYNASASPVTGITAAGDITVTGSAGTTAFTNMYSGDLALTKAPKVSIGLAKGTESANGACYRMFYNLTGVTEADEIRFGSINAYGCQEMYNGCSNLETIQSVLHADTIGDAGCYQMYINCKKLNRACGIQTQGIGTSGCKEMFSTCYNATGPTGITAAGDITVTGSAGTTAFTNMYSGCLALTKAPNVNIGLIQGTVTATGACYRMFYNLTGLQSISSITATTINPYGCEYMFQNCTGLQNLDDVEITATTIHDYCYSYMFTGCGMTDISGLALNTDKVAPYSHQYMFNACKSLADLDGFVLPATDLAEHCYQYMFTGCTGLKSVDNLTLAATELVPYCYSNMFASCTALETPMDKIQVNTIAEQSCAQMFKGCKVLESSPSIVADSVGYNGCWEMFMNCWTSASDGLKTVGDLSFRTIYTRGLYSMFEGCKRLDEVQEEFTSSYVGDYGCSQMFATCSALTETFKMNVAELGHYACQNMYLTCTSLTDMPELPTMNIGNYCYSHMFDGCTNLQNIQSLPVTELREGCYEYMFQNCSTVLAEAPALPATKLMSYCYRGMFKNCKVLEKAPVLGAIKLEPGCYYEMFSGCTKLNYIKVGFSDWKYLTELTTDNGTYNWVTKVAATGDFYCPPSLNQTISDAHHIPAGWNIHPSSGQMLTFEANGGEWVDGTNESITIAQSEINDIPHATKKGCMFTRWNTKADGTGEDINLGNLPDEDMTYYAQYDSIGVQLHKWQNNAIFLSITNLPAEAEEAVIQVVGGGSAKSATLDLSLVDVGVYQLGFNKKDVSLHQGGILDVTIYDEDENVLGVVSLPIPFLISDAVNSSDLDATDNADIWVLNGGTLTFDDNRTCHLLCITAGGKAVVPETSVLTTDSLVLRGGELVNGSYLYDYPQLLVNGSVQNHSGQVNYQYLCGLQQNYTLSLPSSVNVADVKNIDGTDAILGVYRYNGETRAKGQSGWEEIWDPTRDDMTPPILEAGQGYTIYGVPTEIINDRRRNYCYLNFPMTIDLSAGELPEGDGKLVSVTHYGMTDGHLDAGIAPNNAGWNLIGNPYLSNFAGTDETGFENGVIGQLVKDADGNYHWDGDARYVVIPSDNGQSYTAEMVSESTLPAFKNFFIQVSTGDALNFAKAGRQQSAPQRAMQADNEVMLGVRLTGNGVDDRMGILLGDDFSDDYELNADLDKWPNNGLNLSATVGKYNLCIAAISHERVTRPVEMKVITTANDTYRFSLAEEWMKNNGALAHLYLYDREKQTYTDLLKTDYEVSLGTKTHSGRFYLSAEERTTPTQIYEMGENMLYVTATNGHISVSGINAPAHVSVYTMSGICIFNEEVSDVADIHAQCGVYVLRVEIGDEVHARTIVVP